MPSGSAGGIIPSLLLDGEELSESTFWLGIELYIEEFRGGA